MTRQKIKAAPKRLTAAKQKIKLFLLLIIALLTLVSYLPSINNELVNWDDQEYILENPHITTLDFETVKYQFTHEYMGNYHPLTMLSLAVDHKLGGIEPQVYHVHNLMLHLLVSLMVFLFVFQLTASNTVSFITALLFAIHPMHVESVAWASERKDVLYGLYLVIGLWAYLKYLSSITGKIKWVIIFSLAFVLSLLAKAQAVVFPLLCLLLDYYKGRGINRKTILEKIPLLVISILFGLKAIHAQRSFEAIQDFQQYAFTDRLLFSGYGIFTYIWKFLLPLDLSTFYPYPLKEYGYYPVIFYAAPFFVLILVFIIWKFFRQNKVVIFGTLFFLLSISLVLQILPVGGAIISDRYTYIPYIGLSFIAGHYLTKYFSQAGVMKWSGKLFIGMIILIFAFLSYQRAGVWKNSVTLWEDAAVKSKISPKIYNNLGYAYSAAKQYDQALQALNSSLKLKGDYDQALYNRGLVYYYLKKYPEAIDDYTAAIKSNPRLSRAYFNRSGTYFTIGKFKEALVDALKAKEMGYDVDPKYIEAIQGGLKNN